MPLDKRISISSFSNPKVKWITSLKEKRNRDREKVFVMEGYREVSRAVLPKRDYPIPCFSIEFESLWISPDCFLGTNEETLVDQFDCPVYVLPKRVFEKISYRDRPDGILAIARTPDYNLSPERLGNLDINPILIIEGVEKPGNLGTILRTAEGAGVSLVLVTDPRIDLFNPNVVRASTGTLFTLPTYTVELKSALDILSKNKYQILAITPEGKTLYSDSDLRKKSVFLFGSEQYGLSPEAKELSNISVYLPMEGEADSLNLAISTGICLYESLRQRSGKK